MRFTCSLVKRVINAAKHHPLVGSKVGELQLIDYNEKVFSTPVIYSADLRCLVLTNGNYYMDHQTAIDDMAEIVRRNFKDSLVVEIRFLLNLEVKDALRLK